MSSPHLLKQTQYITIYAVGRETYESGTQDLLPTSQRKPLYVGPGLKWCTM